MPKIVGVSNTRKSLRTILEDVVEHDEHYVISRQGRLMAAVIPWEQYANLYLKDNDKKLEKAQSTRGVHDTHL